MLNWLDEVELDEVGTMLSLGENEEQLKQRFKITDLDSLNWTLRKLSALEKEHNEESNLAKAEIDRIQTWFDKRDEAYQYSRQVLEGLIKEYAIEQRVIDPKRKFKTPYGAVSFRKAKKYDYGDEEKLVEFLENNGKNNFVKVAKYPIKTELKKALTITKDGKTVFTDTGEVVPITVEETENVTIKLEG
jgi:hypothetical protein